MKKQLQFLILVIFFCLGFSTTSFASGPPSPPTGTGGSTQCSGNANQHALPYHPLDNPNIVNSTTSCGSQGGSGGCIDPVTGVSIPCDDYIAESVRFTLVISQDINAISPTGISYIARIKDPSTGAVIADHRGTLDPNWQIYEKQDVALGLTWTTVYLPWMHLAVYNGEYYEFTEGSYLLEYEVVSSYCSGGNNCDTYTSITEQQLDITIETDRNGNEYYVPTYSDPAASNANANNTDPISNIVAYPNPTPNGVLNFSFDVSAQSGAEIIVYIRDSYGKTVTQTATQVAQGDEQVISIDFSGYATKNGQLFHYQIIFSDPSNNILADESGQVIYEK